MCFRYLKKVCVIHIKEKDLLYLHTITSYIFREPIGIRAYYAKYAQRIISDTVDGHIKKSVEKEFQIKIQKSRDMNKKLTGKSSRCLYDFYHAL